MAFHMKTYANRYLLEQLKSDCLPFVMHSRSIGMPFEQLGLSVLKNIQLFEQLLLSSGKEISSFRTAVVFNSEFKTIQPFEQQRFFVRQRESNKIQLSFHDALDLLQSTSLSWHIFLYRCQYIHRFFHFHCKKIDEQDAKTKLFTWLSSCFQLRHYGTLGRECLISMGRG